MGYRVTLYVNEQQDLYHTCGVITGLCDLAAEGVIELKITHVRDSKSVLVNDPCTVYLEAESAAHRRELAICVDLDDRSDRICAHKLPVCDLYLKRSFYPSDLDQLVPEYSHRMRIAPFGLNYACRSSASARRVHQALVLEYITKYLRPMILNPRQIKRLLHNELAPWRRFQTSPAVRDFEQPWHVPLEPAILFQTRVWAPEETWPDDFREVNEGRASVVRALRDELGPRFVGGLLPNEYAQRNYPDLITSEQHKRRSYIQLSKRHLIGVYTRGLHHSLAFKLPEYLAASKCIVSDWQRNILPLPLKEDENYLPFNTPSECVQQCVRLLSDEQLADRMRRANFRYYEEEVRPSAHMLRCLERAFNAGSASSESFPLLQAADDFVAISPAEGRS